jgi:hypothetical protein
MRVAAIFIGMVLSAMILIADERMVDCDRHSDFVSPDVHPGLAINLGMLERTARAFQTMTNCGNLVSLQRYGPHSS